ncbi:MAG: DUF4870 domain-containing protein, partial [Streptosporangiaceae bacterium]
RPAPARGGEWRDGNWPKDEDRQRDEARPQHGGNRRHDPDWRLEPAPGPAAAQGPEWPGRSPGPPVPEPRRREPARRHGEPGGEAGDAWRQAAGPAPGAGPHEPGPLPPPPGVAPQFASEGAETAMGAASADEAARRWAMLGYLGVPFLNFLAPLVIYLAMRRSPFVRRHSAQALNLSITVLLYEFSIMIFGALLSLDSVHTALLIVAPIVAALWITELLYLARAAFSATRGEFAPIPGWLCATIVR